MEFWLQVRPTDWKLSDTGADAACLTSAANSAASFVSKKFTLLVVSFAHVFAALNLRALPGEVRDRQALRCLQCYWFNPECYLPIFSGLYTDPYTIARWLWGLSYYGVEFLLLSCCSYNLGLDCRYLTVICKAWIDCTQFQNFFISQDASWLLTRLHCLLRIDSRLEPAPLSTYYFL